MTFLLALLLRLVLPAGDRQSVLGELEELYQVKVARLGRRAAGAWRRRQMTGFLLHLTFYRGNDWQVRTREKQATLPPWRRGATGGGDLLKEVRFTARTLLRARSFLALSTLSLALGLGAATTVFSIANAVLFRPPPFPEPERLFALMQGDFGNHAYPTFLTLREDLSPFMEVAAGDEYWFGASADNPVFLREGDEARPVELGLVSGEYFQVLGVETVRGRPILPEDNRTEGGRPVAVLAWDFWQRVFGGDPDILGKVITLDFTSYEVVGIAPRGFRGTSRVSATEVWVPAVMRRALDSPDQERDLVTGSDWHWIDLFGRLKPGVTVEEARAQANRVVATSLRIPQGLKEDSLTFTPIREATVILPLRESTIRYLTVLFLAVGLVILVVWVNVVNLFLVRLEERSTEISVRRALGAGRLALARQFILEAVFVAGLGGTGAFLLSLWISPALFRLMAPGMRLSVEAADLSPDLRVLGFTVILAVLAGLIIGGVSAFRHRPRTIALLLRRGHGTGEGRHRLLSFQNLLVVGQMTASIVLLAGTGLMFRSFLGLQNQDFGFETENVLTVTLGTERIPLDPPSGLLLYERVLERVRGIPGVDNAALAKVAPLSGVTWGGPMEFEGYDAAGGERTVASENYVDPGYFDMMGIELLRGRFFTAGDRAGAEDVAVVNEALVRRYFAGTEPLGKTIRWSDDRSFTVVGVVRDHFYSSLRRGVVPLMYVPLAQQYQKSPVILLRGRGDPTSLLPEIRAAVTGILPELILYGESTLDRNVVAATSRERATTQLLLGYSTLAFFLALMGTYGVVFRMVLRRRREIGIRRALGAERGEVFATVFGAGMRVVALGIATGLLFAAVAGIVLRSLIFGVAPTDPLTLGAVALAFGGAGALACLLPVRTALKADPVEVLRAE